MVIIRYSYYKYKYRKKQSLSRSEVQREDIALEYLD